MRAIKTMVFRRDKARLVLLEQAQCPQLWKAPLGGCLAAFYLPFAEGIKCLALLLFLAFFRVFRGQPPLTFVFDLELNPP